MDTHPQIKLVSSSKPGRDGVRSWRFAVKGKQTAYFTVPGRTREEAERALEGHLGMTQLAVPENSEGSPVGTAVAVGAIGLVAYGIYKFVEWWRRNEDGPAGRWGLGFGRGNGWINLNPFDKGKAGTGDGGEDIGEKWERAEVAGVKGWRRKGVPLPTEEGGPATYQAAVLIVGDGDSIPELTGWPDNLSVFFVHDPDQPYPDVEGGFGIDALYGTNKPEKKYLRETRYFSCAATDSKSLRKCVKSEIDNMLSIQWI